MLFTSGDSSNKKVNTARVVAVPVNLLHRETKRDLSLLEPAEPS